MNEPLRNRMQDWQETPPPGVWAAISGDLQEFNAEQKLRTRFDQMEAAPPAESWDHISNQLNGNAAAHHAPVIPMRPLSPYLFKYAAAAAAIGFIAWLLGAKFFTPDTNNISVSLVSVDKIIHASGDIPSSSITPKIQDNTDFIAQNLLETGVSEVNTLSSKPLKNAKLPVSTTRHFMNTYVTNMVNYNRRPELTIKVLPVQTLDSRYIIIRDEAGNAIKLSAKFAPLYYSLVSSTDKNNSELLWQSLQQQIIRRPYSPVPDNMMDLLRLWDLMQQEQ